MSSGIMSGSMSPLDEYGIPHAVNANIRSEGISRICSSACEIGSSITESLSHDMPKNGYLLHGMPDFSVVYSFIASVFDPDAKGQLQKLKEMDPINSETVLLLMRNLANNLSSPDFDPLLIQRFHGRRI
ncbi:hypothetical protein Syun_016033 [Stephania yunnanensis]|uniref:Uncharacterized protein n=1 Tax=Stephania yunnanensis TaxID=152371 RepID=A0AAP0J462_9MAGN